MIEDKKQINLAEEVNPIGKLQSPRFSIWLKVIAGVVCFIFTLTQFELRWASAQPPVGGYSQTPTRYGEAYDPNLSRIDLNYAQNLIDNNDIRIIDTLSEGMVDTTVFEITAANGADKNIVREFMQNPSSFQVFFEAKKTKMIILHLC